MAERTQEKKLPAQTRGSKYNFEEWFDGAIWRLFPGEDFTIDITSMRSTLHMAARRMGLKVSTRVSVDEDRQGPVLRVQRVGKYEPRETRKAKTPKVEAPAAKEPSTNGEQPKAKRTRKKKEEVVTS